MLPNLGQTIFQEDLLAFFQVLHFLQSLRLLLLAPLKEVNCVLVLALFNVVMKELLLE